MQQCIHSHVNVCSALNSRHKNLFKDILQASIMDSGYSNPSSLPPHSSLQMMSLLVAPAATFC